MKAQELALKFAANFEAIADVEKAIESNDIWEQMDNILSADEDYLTFLHNLNFPANVEKRLSAGVNPYCVWDEISQEEYDLLEANFAEQMDAIEKFYVSCSNEIANATNYNVLTDRRAKLYNERLEIFHSLDKVTDVNEDEIRVDEAILAILKNIRKNAANAWYQFFFVLDNRD